MERQSKHTGTRAFASQSASVILAILITLSVFLGISGAAADKRANRSYEVVKGMEYLKAAENAPTDEAEALFEARQKEKAEAARSEEERAKLVSDLQNNRVDVFSVFKDYVILGDSRVLGFSHYKFLGYRRVLAGGGDTFIKALDHLNEVKKLKPSYIFLCYGINDAGSARWKTTEAYSADVYKVIETLQKSFPDAKIIVSSAIWISKGAEKSFPKWGRIYEFNPVYKQVCEETGAVYVDNDGICEILKEKKMWSGDGIHLSREFYQYWAKNLWLGAMEEQGQ